MTLLHWVTSYLAHLLLLPLYLTKPKLRAGLVRRLWLHRGDASHRHDKDAMRVWAHGASAGDVLCLRPLLQQLGGWRALDLTVTAYTATGVEMAEQHYADANVDYLPLDLPGATRRAVRALRPDVLMLERAELWPALIRRAHAAGTVIALVNGHIAPRSMRPYRLLFGLTGPVSQTSICS